MSGQQIPAGWYHMDGDAPNTQRWWDGTQWTSEMQAVAAATPAPQQVAPAEQSAFAQPVEPSEGSAFAQPVAAQPATPAEPAESAFSQPVAQQPLAPAQQSAFAQPVASQPDAGADSAFAQPVAAQSEAFAPEGSFEQPVMAQQAQPGAAVAGAEPTVEYGSLLTNDLASYWESMDEPADAAAQFSEEYALETEQAAGGGGGGPDDVDLTPSFDAPEGSVGEANPLQWMFLPYKHYAQFKGRSCRAEYWWSYLFQFVAWGVLGFVSALVTASSQPGEVSTASLAVVGAMGIFWLVSILPTWAVTVRRLHDTGRSGWTMLISLIPFIGALILLAYLVTPGNAGWNKYGQDHIRP